MGRGCATDQKLRQLIGKKNTAVAKKIREIAEELCFAKSIVGDILKHYHETGNLDVKVVPGEMPGSLSGSYRSLTGSGDVYRPTTVSGGTPPPLDCWMVSRGLLTLCRGPPEARSGGFLATRRAFTEYVKAGFQRSHDDSYIRTDSLYLTRGEYGLYCACGSSEAKVELVSVDACFKSPLGHSSIDAKLLVLDLILRISVDANLVGETRVEKSIEVRCFVENVQFFVSTPKVPVPTRIRYL
ncbi:hypothetical protein NQ318_016847 [Aromia moschata]|uniref:Paired domain-containing protein n=1 Tax=Aromia moschata TaxID=1265417 RepID=A0AAV8YTS6_9CUCU|nr:hypothetical protein NQ318_016847 [Aromia moschata]